MYHGLNGVVADCDLYCFDCAFNRYGNLANYRRVARAIKGKDDYDLPIQMRRMGRQFLGHPTYEHVDVKEHRTLRDAFEYGVWHGLMLDDLGEKIGYIDDYNNVWEDYDHAWCCDCNGALDTIVLCCKDDPSIQSCYGIDACECEDCERGRENAQEAC